MICERIYIYSFSIVVTRHKTVPMHGMQLSIKYDNSMHIKEEKVPSFRFLMKKEYIDESSVTRSVYLVTILTTIGRLIVAQEHTSVNNETKHSPVIIFLSFLREGTQANPSMCISLFHTT